MNGLVLTIAIATLVLTAGCGSGGDSSTMDVLGVATDDDSSTIENTNNQSQPSVPLDTILTDVLNELVGYQSESLAEKMYELAFNIEATATSVLLPSIVVSTEVVSFADPSVRTSFDCPFGGTMIRVSDSAVESLGGPTREFNEYELYEFDQCVMGISGGSLANGSYEMNGSYTYETYRRSSSGGSIRETVATWDTFNLRHMDGVSYEFDGTLTLGLSSNSGSAETTRDSQILRYIESSGDTTTVELVDVEFFQRRRPVQFAERFEGPREVLINGTYIGLLSQSEALQINTITDFSESISSTAEFNEPLTGSLQVTSTDGGVLTVTANGALAISFLGADGAAIESVLEELPVFDLLGPGCIPGGGFFDDIEIESCSF